MLTPNLQNLQKNSLIGIWGFGAMGKSAVQYLRGQGYRVQVMDCRILTDKEQQFLRDNDSKWFSQTTTESDLFFNSSDIIIPSPGININKYNYATFSYKFITELDFFYHHFNKPIIAITGSVGKTSITSILSQIFSQSLIPIVVGGNIGIPTFDLLSQHNSVDYALLEVSSFQLQFCTHFAPHLAIWTNIYPNHLDYHATQNEYFTAKTMLLKYQKNNSVSLVPLSLRKKLSLPADRIRSYFTTEPLNLIELNTLSSDERLYYIENNHIMCYAHFSHKCITSLTPELINLSFIDNILIIASACDLIGIDLSAMQSIAQTQSLPAHRMEYIGTINNVIFYNDSKATTTISTLAALEKLHDKTVHLLLGGLSKGVDRASFITQLKNKAHYVYCFGKEAALLYDMCIKNDISATPFINLDDAFKACMQTIRPHDCVLLSPAGSSFDLYTNYEERGEHFKTLFSHYQQRQSV